MFVVFLEHVAHFSLDELGQPLLHVAGDFAAILAMAVGNGEKVAILEAAEVGDSDPSVLILLVRIGRGLPCLRGEGELSDAIGKHLSRVGSIVAVLLATLCLTLCRVG